jgi:hypothetical protein
VEVTITSTPTGSYLLWNTADPNVSVLMCECYVLDTAQFVANALVHHAEIVSALAVNR